MATTIRNILSHNPTTPTNNRSSAISQSPNQHDSDTSMNMTNNRTPIKSTSNTLNASLNSTRSSSSQNGNGDGELLCRILIPPGDWERISRNYSIVSSTGRVRKKYLVIFHDYLCMRAQRLGLMCWLTNKFNWVNQTNPAWRGQYNCIDPNCTAKYTGLIESINPDGMTELQLYKSGQVTHLRPLQKSTRFSKRVQVKRQHHDDNNQPTDGEQFEHEYLNNNHDSKIDLGENEYGDEEIGEEEIEALDLLLDQQQQQQQQQHDGQNHNHNQIEDHITNEINNTNDENHNHNETNGINHENDDEEDFFYNPTAPTSTNQVHADRSNPNDWSVEEVCDFVTALVGSEIAGQFKWHDIDGQALDYLNVENLFNLMRIKLGPACRIKSHFDQVKRAYLDSIKFADNTN